MLVLLPEVEMREKKTELMMHCTQRAQPVEEGIVAGVVSLY
jgi:hypothetical protein